MTAYRWAVPVSSESPHLAHLIAGPKARRLCRPDVYVNDQLMTVVDSARYRPKCKVCLRMARQNSVVITRS